MRIKDLVQRHPLAISAALAILAGGVSAWTIYRSTASPASKAEIELVVRDYILAHPEVIPQAIEKLRERQGQDAYKGNKAALETPFASAWAGAEHGDVTLVMFTDYACGYCRSSLADVDRLIASDPRLKVVWREIPILGPGSEMAAKAGLAAARQGAFRQFHQRMFAAGAPDSAKISAILRSMNLDHDRIERDAASPEVTAELRKNLELAGRIDDAIATPTFVVGGRLLKGAVGYDALKQAVDEARKRT